MLPITAHSATELAIDAGSAFDWSSSHDAEAWIRTAQDADTVQDIARHLERYGLKA